MIYKLIIILALTIHALQAATWVTIKEGGGSGHGLSYTTQIQKDTDSTTPTTESVRFVVVVSGSPTPGSGPAYVQYAIWRGSVGSGVYITGGNMTGPYTQTATLGPATWANTDVPTIEANVQNSGPVTGQSAISGSLGQQCDTTVNITNNYGVAIWYRAVHSIDGVLGQIMLKPGESWSQSWDVSCGGNVRVDVQIAPNQEPQEGVWQRPEDFEPEDNPADPDSWDSGEPVDVEFPGDPVPAPAPSLPSAPLPSPTRPAAPWNAPTPSTTDESRLDKDTYKEGVNKIISELKQNIPERDDTSAERTEKMGLITSAIAPLSADISGEIPVPNSMGSITDTQLDNTESLVSLNVPNLARIAGAPSTVEFKISSLWPNWQSYAVLIREIILWAVALVFAQAMQAKFRIYYLAWWQAIQSGTTVEPVQIAIPGSGIAKQISTALIVTAVFVGVITTTIVLFNTQLASILASGSLINVASTVGSKASAIFGNSLFSVAYDLCNSFVPLPALLFFWGSNYVITWAMPVLWTIALITARNVKI